MADLKGEMDREINAAKYTYKEHGIPNLKGDPYTLKTEHKDDQPTSVQPPETSAEPGAQATSVQPGPATEAPQKATEPAAEPDKEGKA